MHPIILELGPLKIHSYGFMLAIAFLVGIWLARRYAERLGEDPEKLTNMAFWILLSAIVGSRMFHVFVFWEEMTGFWSIFKIWEGGLVYYGGFIGATVAAVIYCRVHKLDAWQMADLLAPSTALGLMFGRIGCTLVGCCYGKPCPADFSLGITFPPQSIGVAGIPLYPTQPAEAIGSLLIFLFLWFYLRRHRAFRGQIIVAFVLLYSALRTALEFWRADPRGFLTLFHVSGPAGQTAESAGGFFGWLLWAETLQETASGVYAVCLSESQAVSLALTAVAVLLGIYKWRRDRRLGIEPGRLGPMPRTLKSNRKEGE